LRKQTHEGIAEAAMGDWPQDESKHRDLFARYGRYLGRNAPEVVRQEELLKDARAWAEAALSEIASHVHNIDELKKRVVRQTWDNFLSTHRYRSDFKLGYLEFTPALWEEGSPSLEDLAALRNRQPEGTAGGELNETVSDRKEFWCKSANEAAFVAAYRGNSATSEELLANTTPKQRVLYHDLERTIWMAWQVRPDDVTVNDVRRALHLLASDSKGDVELDQISCDAYGIDYSRLNDLMRASLPRGSDPSSGPKVPRITRPEPQTNAKDEPERTVRSDGATRRGESVTVETNSSKPKPVRRHPMYEAIDAALREAAKSLPKNHEDVFRALDGRAATPNAKPFKPAGGWYKGFLKDPAAARAWLSKNWARLRLKAFIRGPK
jgi:hypothetical protein